MRRCRAPRRPARAGTGPPDTHGLLPTTSPPLRPLQRLPVLRRPVLPRVPRPLLRPSPALHPLRPRQPQAPARPPPQHLRPEPEQDANQRGLCLCLCLPVRRNRPIHPEARWRHQRPRKKVSSFSSILTRPHVNLRLNTLGYRIGARVLELMSWRAESSSKAPKREIRLVPALMAIHTQVWKAVYGKSADAIEKSVENADECEPGNPGCPAPHLNPFFPDMIIDNDPPIERNISVPRDMGGLSCSSFTAGIVEAVLDGLGFVCQPLLLVFSRCLCFYQPARVTAHSTPTLPHPSRTTILIKLEKSVLEREELLK